MKPCENGTELIFFLYFSSREAKPHWSELRAKFRAEARNAGVFSGEWVFELTCVFLYSAQMESLFWFVLSFLTRNPAKQINECPAPLANVFLELCESPNSTASSCFYTNGKFISLLCSLMRMRYCIWSERRKPQPDRADTTSLRGEEARSGRRKVVSEVSQRKESSENPPDCPRHRRACEEEDEEKAGWKVGSSETEKVFAERWSTKSSGVER